MTVRIVVIALLALALSPCGLQAGGFETGSSLLEMCEAKESEDNYYQNIANCRGYIVGSADMFDCQVEGAGFNWDSSQRVTQGQVVRIVVRWLNDHPQYLHYTAGGLIAAALAEAFPCP